jgi:hypothetical protein
LVEKKDASVFVGADHRIGDERKYIATHQSRLKR